MMKKFEAPTLAEACAQASKEFGCNIEDLEYNIVQYPKKGIFGLFAKPAIIVAIKKSALKGEEAKEEKKQEPAKTPQPPQKEEKIESSSVISSEIEVVDSFFSNEPKKVAIKQKTQEPGYEKITAPELENKIKELFAHSCFDIDTIEVDIEDNTAYIFIDGNDAALLIGKEGYRYNALSYLLFNWINAKYGLYVKLEIAQFLASQQEMIKFQMQPVIEHVKREGWGKTRELNGILVQIALEYLRDVFPNKYVAIKKSPSGEKYIVINEFNKRQ